MLVDMNRKIYIYNVRDQISNDIQIVADILGLKTDACYGRMIYFQKWTCEIMGCVIKMGKCLRDIPI